MIVSSREAGAVRDELASCGVNLAHRLGVARRLDPAGSAGTVSSQGGVRLCFMVGTWRWEVGG